jgi:hypothetical protein
MFLNKKFHILIYLIFCSFFAYSQSGKNNILLTCNVDPNQTFKQNQEDNFFTDSTVIADDTLVFDDIDDPRKPRKSIYNVGNKSNSDFSIDKKENVAFSNNCNFINDLNITSDNLELEMENDAPTEALNDKTITVVEKTNLQINLYPNPVVTYLTVSSNLEIDELWLTSISGQRFIITMIDQKIDMSTLAEGWYILSVSVNNIIENNKIFVKR